MFEISSSFIISKSVSLPFSHISTTQQFQYPSSSYIKKHLSFKLFRKTMRLFALNEAMEGRLKSVSRTFQELSERLVDPDMTPQV